MINLQKIKIFLSSSETLNFTETARALFISQQAVSKCISELEGELGFKLFIRSYHSIELTPQGARLREYFRDVLDSFEKLTGELKKEQELQGRSLNIGYNIRIDFADDFAQIDNSFYKKYPDAVISAEKHHPDVLFEGLVKNQLDILVTFKRFLIKPEKLSVHELKNIPLVVIAKADKVDALKEPDAALLSDEPLIINRFGGETQKDTEERALKGLEETGLSNRNIVICSNRDSLYTAVKMGKGIAISSSMAEMPSGIKALPLNSVIEDVLVCAYRSDEKREIVRDYAMEVVEYYKQL